MDKQGLVAPVWSDAGEVPAKVTYGPLRTWLEGEIAKIVQEHPGLAEVFGVDPPATPSDPNAKPALPALNRVSGNKRGPGWCSEE